MMNVNLRFVNLFKSSEIIEKIVATLLGSTQIAAASTADTDTYITSHCKNDRPAINPDFAPNESRQFDAYQIKCIPGSVQECPEGFAENEDSMCNPGGLSPEGYHGEDDDESGQCYPNSEGCNTYTITKDETRVPFVLLTDRPDDKPDRCAKPSYLCHEDPTHEVRRSEVS
ncbi:MAG: hypothetical protein WBL67_09090 [Nitrososphaeraceae archaeon]